MAARCARQPPSEPSCSVAAAIAAAKRRLGVVVNGDGSGSDREGDEDDDPGDDDDGNQGGRRNDAGGSKEEEEHGRGTSRAIKVSSSRRIFLLQDGGRGERRRPTKVVVKAEKDYDEDGHNHEDDGEDGDRGTKVDDDNSGDLPNKGDDDGDHEYEDDHGDHEKGCSVGGDDDEGSVVFVKVTPRIPSRPHGERRGNNKHDDDREVGGRSGSSSRAISVSSSRRIFVSEDDNGGGGGLLRQPKVAVVKTEKNGVDSSGPFSNDYFDDDEETPLSCHPPSHFVSYPSHTKNKEAGSDHKEGSKNPTDDVIVDDDDDDPRCAGRRGTTTRVRSVDNTISSLTGSNCSSASMSSRKPRLIRRYRDDDDDDEDPNRDRVIRRHRDDERGGHLGRRTGGGERRRRQQDDLGPHPRVIKKRRTTDEMLSAGAGAPRSRAVSYSSRIGTSSSSRSSKAGLSSFRRRYEEEEEDDEEDDDRDSSEAGYSNPEEDDGDNGGSGDGTRRRGWIQDFVGEKKKKASASAMKRDGGSSSNGGKKRQDCHHRRRRGKDDEDHPFPPNSIQPRIPGYSKMRMVSNGNTGSSSSSSSIVDKSSCKRTLERLPRGEDDGYHHREDHEEVAECEHWETGSSDESGDDGYAAPVHRQKKRCTGRAAASRPKPGGSPSSSRDVVATAPKKPRVARATTNTEGNHSSVASTSSGGGGRAKQGAVRARARASSPAPLQRFQNNVPMSHSPGVGFHVGNIGVRKVRAEDGKGEVCFLSMVLGKRVLTVECSLRNRPSAHDGANAAAGGDAEHQKRFTTADMSEYELVSVKQQKDCEANVMPGMPAPACLQYIYALVSGTTSKGLEIPRMNLEYKLSKLANFGGLPTVKKIVARLELLQSPVYKSKSKLNHVLDLEHHGSNDGNNKKTGKDGVFGFSPEILREIPEDGNVGCGFIDEELLAEMFGGTAGGRIGDAVSAIQVRIYAPKFGLFKGMLQRTKLPRGDKCRILLPGSMRKVGPSLHTNDHSTVIVAVTRQGAHPNTTNRTMGKILSGEPAPPSFKPKKLSDMITRLWRGLRVPERQCERYASLASEAENVKHAWVAGTVDPTGKLPPKTVFIPGLHCKRNELSRSVKHMFVSRSPAVEIQDGRLIEVVWTKPPDMSAGQWKWLTEQPFGTIIFAKPPQGKVDLPSLIASGDLDGDLYFICWSSTILKCLRDGRAVERPRFVAAKQEDPAPPPPQMQVPRKGWLSEAQDLMIDSASMRDLGELVGKLYTMAKKVADANPDEFMTHPDCIAYARAYKEALDLGKHGGEVELPSHLWDGLPRKLYKFLKGRGPGPPVMDDDVDDFPFAVRRK